MRHAGWWAILAYIHRRSSTWRRAQYPRLQIVLKHNALRRVTDVPLGGRDIVRLGLEASLQNLGMAQLLMHAATMAIKKEMIERILHESFETTSPLSSTHDHGPPSRT